MAEVAAHKPAEKEQVSSSPAHMGSRSHICSCNSLNCSSSKNGLAVIVATSAILAVSESPTESPLRGR